MCNQDFLDACREYFEISIGYRRPSTAEKREASKLWLQTVFSDHQMKSIDIIKALKCPINLSSGDRSLYNASLPSSKSPEMNILLMELEIFRLLSDETDFVNGPYIPILRYEIRAQKTIFKNSEFYYAVLRQHAFLETFFRMKAGLGHVKWRWALKSVYRGEHLIDEETFTQLNDFNDVRNNLAHHWFSYLELSEKSVRRSAKKGLNVISRLLTAELHSVFDSYCSKHASQRFPTKLEHRVTSSISSSANASVMITCDNCEYEFNPQNHWKRCPECHFCHDYWKE